MTGNLESSRQRVGQGHPNRFMPGAWRHRRSPVISFASQVAYGQCTSRFQYKNAPS